MLFPCYLTDQLLFEALFDLWNDSSNCTIIHRCLLLSLRSQEAPWFTEIKYKDKEDSWSNNGEKKTFEESIKEEARTHFKASSIEMIVEKKQYLSISIVSAQHRLKELFSVLRGLLGGGRVLWSLLQSFCSTFCKLNPLHPFFLGLHITWHIIPGCPILWDTI